MAMNWLLLGNHAAVCGEGHIVIALGYGRSTFARDRRAVPAILVRLRGIAPGER